MSDSKPTPKEVEELVELAQGFCDGTMTDPAVARLESLLLGNPLMQRIFLAHVDLHARLCWEAGHGVPASNPASNTSADLQSASKLEVARPAPARSKVHFWNWVAAAMFLIAAGAAFSQLELRKAIFGVPNANNPTVVHASGMGPEQVASLTAGKTLKPGLIELPHGIVELLYPSGIRLLVESPARVELRSAEHTYLKSGRIVAKVPKNAIGYTIETDRAKVVDLGTEFGISVSPSGDTCVQVYEGEVEAGLKRDAGLPELNDRLTAGEAISFEQTLRPIPFEPHRFVRSFPVAPKLAGPIELSNEIQVESLRVGRTAGPMRIDGNLEDWTGATKFLTRCEEPQSERYYIEAQILRDDERLYFAAHVGDPNPMSNTVDAREEPDFFWTGGSLVLRVATDPAFTWPFEANRPKNANSQPSQFDLSDRIVHIGMLYSQRAQAPQLVLQYGMDCHGQKLCGEGWKGAFVKDEDGNGYTVEYSIDLKLLNIDHSPKSGESWPAFLSVHWSDYDGRTCMGNMSEIARREDSHPDASASDRYVPNPFRGSCWGRLQFED